MTGSVPPEAGRLVRRSDSAPAGREEQMVRYAPAVVLVLLQAAGHALRAEHVPATGLSLRCLVS